MSEALLEKSVELAWQHWTALGVAGVAPLPEHAIDLEALIAFTPFVAAADPRLERECVDWCARIGPRHLAISRLRQIARMMPARAEANVIDLPALLIEGEDLGAKLSKKSRAPRLEHPSLIRLRSRHIFGLGARADLLVSLAMRARDAEAFRVSSIRPTGYGKRAIALVIDDLADAGVLERLEVGTTATYKLLRRAPLRALLEPLPKRAPNWSKRFALVANVLEAWRRFGTRSSYAIELVKVLDKVRPLAAALEAMPRLIGHPTTVVNEVERWSTALLDP